MNSKVQWRLDLSAVRVENRWKTQQAIRRDHLIHIVDEPRCAGDFRLHVQDNDADHLLNARRA
jgi:hypothetical protein